MKVKNVLKGICREYALEEITIMTDEKVIYSGTLEGWNGTSVDMILYKKEVENMEVVKRLMFNRRKAFIFV